MKARALIAKVIHDCLTGPDGETYAIGRVGAALLIFVGLLGPSILAGILLFTVEPTLEQWNGFLNALTAYLPALIAGVTALVRLTNATEPTAP